MKQLDLQLKQNQRLFILYGKETFLIQQAQTKIINTYINEDDEFSVVTYDMDNSHISEAVLEASTVPFFVNNKVVICKNCYFLSAENKKDAIKQDVESLLDYLKNPAPFSVMILICPTEKIDQRKNIVKKLKQQGYLYSAETPDNSTLKNWIHHRLKRHHITIAPKALEKLLLLTDDQMTQIESELTKLILYLDGAKEITEEMIEQNVSPTLEQNVFKLSEYILQNKGQAALSLVEDLLLTGHEPIALVALIASQFRIMYQVKLLQSKGYRLDEIASRLKQKNLYRVKYTVDKIRHYSLGSLYHIMVQLAECDKQLKSSSLDRKMILELLILSLLGKK